jgi:hypothetical protein
MMTWEHAERGRRSRTRAGGERRERERPTKKKGGGNEERGVECVQLI